MKKYFSCFLFAFGIITTTEAQLTKAPRIFLNDFKDELIKVDSFVNCRKVSELGVVVYLNEAIQQYDMVKVEFHRYGPKDDMVVGWKELIPKSDEFKKKYEGKDSVKLKLLTKETQFSTTDFKYNSIDFPPDLYIIDIYCNYHEKQHCNFYVITKGYKITGKNSFGDNEFDKGVELSPKGVSFRNWDFTTK